jgi:hypothetical protein
MKLIKSNLKMSGLCLLLLAICSCARSSVESNQTSSQLAKENAEPQPAVTPSEVTDPTCCGLDYNHEGLPQAWRQFTENGQFRLARLDEMNFPESAKREWASDWKSINKPFRYAWGERGFDTNKDHLVAIVVDTKRNDPERFGLVIFSSPRNSKEYRPYWLYRNRDLSRMLILAFSGGLTLSQYDEAGSKKTCNVFWNQKSKQYYCKS